MSKRLLCVWLPNWPIQRIQAEDPTLAEKPLLLSTRDPRRGLLVAAANLAAREENVKPGMRLSEATALVEAEVLEQDTHEELEGLCHLAEQMQLFSPIVGLEQLERKTWAGRNSLQPECLLLDITSIGQLFGSEEELVQQFGAWLRERHLFGCIAVAGSIGAAWAIANYGLRRESALQCNLSDDDEQPESLPACRYQIVEVDQRESEKTTETQSAEEGWYDRAAEAAIADLPIAALRLASDTVHSLRRLGIHRVGQLQTLPRQGMGTRLGEQLLLRWDQALDRKEEPVVTLHSLPDWCLEESLEYPTEHQEVIAELLRRNGEVLAKRLRKRGQGALRILCRLDLVDAQPLLMQLGMFRPTNDAEHLEELLVGQLEQVLQENSISAVWRLSLQATLTDDMIWRQADLFEGDRAANRNQMAKLIDTLSSRLGRKQVMVGNVRRESQPELAYQLQPMTGRKQDGKQQDTVKKLSSRLARRRAEPSTEDPLRRPTHLYKKPQPIEVAFAKTNESIEDGPRLATAPNSFLFQGKTFRVTASCGPERLESGWWRGPSVRRDYYRIEVQDGSWWWIYRDLNTATWFLHGIFD
ncbi:MAG: DNA polymerase Y family protein [Planctomycetota bacterium]